MRKHVPLLTAVLVAGLLVIPATYAVLRGYDVLFKAEANPATVIWSNRIAMFWRLSIGGYFAGMVAFVVYLAARRNLARTIQTLDVLVLVVAAMITVQGLLLP
jgi:hypothetical protein